VHSPWVNAGNFELPEYTKQDGEPEGRELSDDSAVEFVAGHPGPGKVHVRATNSVGRWLPEMCAFDLPVCAPGGGGGDHNPQVLEIHELELAELLATVAVRIGE
jgi:hypothetical protein